MLGKLILLFIFFYSNGIIKNDLFLVKTVSGIYIFKIDSIPLNILVCFFWFEAQQILSMKSVLQIVVHCIINIGLVSMKKLNNPKFMIIILIKQNVIFTKMT